MAGPPSYDRVCGLLREHREEMRIMSGFIADYDLEEELEARVIEETGNAGFYLGPDDPDLDPDGGEPPESRAWKAMACEQERFIQATLGLGQHKVIEEQVSRARLDLERARMRGEDRAAVGLKELPLAQVTMPSATAAMRLSNLAQ
jgi:hypothetical protein